MFPLLKLLVPRSWLITFDMSMELIPTTNIDSHIYPWRIYRLLGVVVCGYLIHFLLGLLLLIYGNYFFSVKREQYDFLGIR